MKQRPIGLKRAYEPPAAEDGRRFLVERLWPRGVRKADLRLDRPEADVPVCALEPASDRIHHS